jgi:predicted dehydrogenase
MDIPKIAVVGAGQLGSRHLQALAKSSLPIRIEVADVNEAALRTAKARLDQVGENTNLVGVTYLKTTDELDKNIDLCIVATNSDVRAHVLRRLLTRNNIKYLILEKVLFQTENDYETIGKLIAQKRVKAWVNCPRRVYPFYAEIGRMFDPGEKVFYEVHGGNWGLGSNAIHFIDHLAFLAGCLDYSLDISGLDDRTLECKRDGFIEMSGTLRGTFSNGSEIVLHSKRTSSAPVTINILGENCLAAIHEDQGEAWLAAKENNWKREKKHFRMPYQSELTHLIAQDILERGECGLTPFMDSVRLHLPLIKSLLKHVVRCGAKRTKACQIT